MYTHDELFLEVKRHLRNNYNIEIYDADKAGGKEGYSEEEAQKIARELVSELEYAFASAQKHGGVFGGAISQGARITYTTKHTKDGKLYIHVNFPAKYLFRPSLWKEAGYQTRTGDGINDIFALFTNGYRTSKKTPAGFWYSQSRQVEIGHVKAPNVWYPNPFISDTIDEFEIKYPGVLIEYPEEWH